MVFDGRWMGTSQVGMREKRRKAARKGGFGGGGRAKAGSSSNSVRTPSPQDSEKHRARARNGEEGAAGRARQSAAEKVGGELQLLAWRGLFTRNIGEVGWPQAASPWRAVLCDVLGAGAAGRDT